jgi:hypothetical protein
MRLVDRGQKRIDLNLDVQTLVNNNIILRNYLKHCVKPSRLTLLQL